MNFKHVLIVGMAKSGIAAVNLLNKKNINYSIYDNKNLNQIEILKNENLILTNAENLYFGDDTKKILNDLNLFDLIVLSPVINPELDFLKKAKESNIKIIGEFELGYIFSKSKNFIGITGTNGKTTTTMLTYEIFKDNFNDVRLVGNIGNPICNEVINDDENTIYICEISSYQLETLQKFKFKIAAITNITPDHLDRHKTFENYKNIKFKIRKHLENDNFIINIDDEIIKKEIEHNEKNNYTTISTINYANYFLNNNILYKLIDKNEYLEILNINDMKIFGNHNIQNTLIAIAISDIMGINLNKIKNTVVNFMGVEHRIEYVGEYKSNYYYNDSKATNPESTIVAIKSMKLPTILLCGGSDKQSDYSNMISYFNNIVDFVILYGDTKYDIEKALKKQNYYNYKIVNNLEEAFLIINKNNFKNHNVLLSPACASFDQYKSFEERGKHFKKLFENLKNGASNE